MTYLCYSQLFNVYSPGPWNSILFSGKNESLNRLVLLEKGANLIEVLFISFSKYSSGPKLFFKLVLLLLLVQWPYLDPKNCLNLGSA